MRPVQKVSSIGDFSQATPSAYAEGYSTAAKIIQLQTEQQLRAQQLAQQEQALEGKIATWSGNAIEESSNEAAKATEIRGWSQIAQSSSSLAGEATGFFGSGRYKKTELESVTKQLNNVTSHEDAIREVETNPNLKAALTVPGQNKALRDADMAQKLRRTDIKKEAYNQKDLESTLQHSSLRNSKSSESRKAFDEYKKDVRATKKSLESQKDSIQSSQQRFDQRCGSLGQILGGLGNGIGTVSSAEAEKKKADADNLQEQTKFASSSVRGLLDSINKLANDLNDQKRTTVDTLLSGVGQSNHV